MARILRTSYTAPGQEVISKALETVRECGLVVGPTDTLYGIFTNPFSRECVDKVYRVKRRTGKPIPLLADSIESILEHAVFDDKIKRFLETIGYGPVTVVLRIKRDSRIAWNVHLGSYKVGFRIPASPFPRMIAAGLGGLVTGTSANISGWKPPRTVSEAINQLGDSIDLYVDSGYTPLGTGSTVIDLSEGFKVIRYGVVNPDLLRRIYETI